jgi:lipopolysaccharide transport system ATP-binding protein
MSSDKVAISVKGLGKKYTIGGPQEKYRTFRDAIVNSAKAPFRRLSSSEPLREFWALKDVSFNVEPGEVVGIIGRNGAGKSTLLKILSRITSPTEGTVDLYGRVGSLLEVGTGFHPELTGRENIFLSGSILGMKKREIDAKLDEIVKFSEIEKFLDTPVKRYSSGMYVRLAFAVAAHLETEILLIDEVLAVGDAAFQKKCLGKMGDVATKEGRTVLFVSHNMNAIEQLCSSCILIEKGHITQKGQNVSQIIKSYLFPDNGMLLPSQWTNSGFEFENPWFKPNRFFIKDSFNNILNNPVSNNQDIWLQIEGTVDALDPALVIGYSIVNAEGATIYVSYFNDQDISEWPVFSPGEVTLKTKIPRRFLNEGSYIIELRVQLHYRMRITEPGKKAPSINLLIRGGLSDSPYWTEKRIGIIAPVMEWEGILKNQKTMETIDN